MMWSSPSGELDGSNAIFRTPAFAGWRVLRRSSGGIFPPRFNSPSCPVHGIEDACFLLAGLLFWWPVVQPPPSATRSPHWSVPLYLFLATLPCDILSAFLAFCNRVVYPSYLSTTQLFSLSPLEDQQCAGALMWVWITFAYLIPAVVITLQILSPPSTHSHEAVKASRHGLAARSLNASEAEVP